MAFHEFNCPYDPIHTRTSGTYRVNVGKFFYLGSTRRFGFRNSNHKCDLEQGKHQNKQLQAAYDECREYEFIMLLEIPTYPARDTGNDHRDRLEHHEQKLINQHWGDPFLCNASNSARHNSGIGAVMKERWQDPEFRANQIAIMNANRKPVSAETKAKMSESKRGAKHPRARAVRMQFQGAELDFPTTTQAAAHFKVSQQTMNLWIKGKIQWPGKGAKPPKPQNRRLIGLTGQYL